MTDSLWAMARGKVLEARFLDFLDPQPQETRTAEEIIAQIRGKIASL